MRVALVSPEVSPFTGGGIAPIVRATAQILAAAGHDVHVFTRAAWASEALRLRADRVPAFSHPRITWRWVPEPTGPIEEWSVELAERFGAHLRSVAAVEPFDLIEFQDFGGIGAFVVADAAHGAPEYAQTRIVVRLESSLELVDALDLVAQPTQERLAITALERVLLLGADALVSPSTRASELYTAFYPELDLPPSHVVAPPFLTDDAPVLEPAPPARPELHVLYLGRMQEFKGVLPLVEGLVARPELPVRLTMVGADTHTGPGGASMRETLRERSAGDDRITILDPVPRSKVAPLLASADALVVPSRWETWGNVGLDGLAAGRPLLVTPVASLPDMAGNGRFGVVAEGGDAGALADLLATASDERGRLRALAGNPELPQHLRALTDSATITADYERLADAPLQRDQTGVPTSADLSAAARRPQTGRAVSAERLPAALVVR